MITEIGIIFRFFDRIKNVWIVDSQYLFLLFFSPTFSSMTTLSPVSLPAVHPFRFTYLFYQSISFYHLPFSSSPPSCFPLPSFLTLWHPDPGDNLPGRSGVQPRQPPQWSCGLRSHHAKYKCLHLHQQHPAVRHWDLPVPGQQPPRQRGTQHRRHWAHCVR